MRYLTGLLAVAAVVGAASAGTWEESGVSVHVNRYLPGPVPGYVTNDIYVVTSNCWLSSQLLVELDQGTIYQHPVNDEVYPQPAWWPLIPELEFDSVVTDGQTPPGAASIAGGAVNIGGATTYTHDAGLIDIAWFVTGSTAQGDFMLARVTLSQDVCGTWSFRTTAQPLDGPYAKLLDVPIVDGYLTIIPEPTTGLLLLLGGLGVPLGRRR